MTHGSQETLGLLDGTIAAEEPDNHHHSANGDQDVDACRDRTNINTGQQTKPVEMLQPHVTARLSCVQSNFV